MLEPPAFPPLNPLADFSENGVNLCYTSHFLPRISFWLSSDVFSPLKLRELLLGRDSLGGVPGVLELGQSEGWISAP